MYKTIPNFEDYEITEYGDIRRKPKKHVSSKGIKPTLTPKGYYRIGLQVNGKYKWKGIHGLVALTFIPNPNGYTEINHKDGNKLNNHVSNLEWCTKSYNAQYNVFLGINPKGVKVGTSKLTEEDVKNIYKCLSAGIKSKDIAKVYKICTATVHSIGNGKWWKSLNLPPLVMNPLNIKYDTIIEVENLLNGGLSETDITKKIKTCFKTVKKIKKKYYENYKTHYRRFILERV
jgi:transcriptional regulator